MQKLLLNQGPTAQNPQGITTVNVFILYPSFTEAYSGIF